MQNFIELNDLNDDCLLEIFKYLSAEDLCALKRTNRRFFQLTDYYFHTVYEVKEREVVIKGTDGCKLRDILKNVGRFVRNLTIDSPSNYSDMNDLNDRRCDKVDDSTYIGELIGSLCSDKLKILRLHSVYLSGFRSTHFGYVCENAVYT